VRVRFTPEARLSTREKRAWWSAQRDKAPDPFVEELAVIVAKLRDGADNERQQYAARRGRVIWPILMPRPRHHVYHRAGTVASDVEVLLVWNAIAGAPPVL
jgi:hypothetical protein